jgi:hypothetical protein
MMFKTLHQPDHSKPVFQASLKAVSQNRASREFSKMVSPDHFACTQGQPKTKPFNL